MTIFRNIVSTCIINGNTFSVVTDAIKTSVRSNIQSLDDEPVPQPTEKALTAKVRQSDQEIFQEGINFQKAQESKRQRISQNSNGQCNFWDGNVCDYEDKTKKTCRFSDNHISGRNTFKVPFEIKQHQRVNGHGAQTNSSEK
jgi:hypothetical protein